MTTHDPMCSDEHWKPVLGYENLYEVSTHGQVRSVAKTITRMRNGKLSKVTRLDRLLFPSKTKYGYATVGLSKQKKAKSHLVHTLVLEAHLKPRPPGYIAVHIDSNVQNNHIDNLKWISRSEHMKKYSNFTKDHRCTVSTLIKQGKIHPSEVI